MNEDYESIDTDWPVSQYSVKYKCCGCIAKSWIISVKHWFILNNRVNVFGYITYLLPDEQRYIENQDFITSNFFQMYLYSYVVIIILSNWNGLCSIRRSRILVHRVLTSLRFAPWTGHWWWILIRNSKLYKSWMRNLWKMFSQRWIIAFEKIVLSESQNKI